MFWAIQRTIIFHEKHILDICSVLGLGLSNIMILKDIPIYVLGKAKKGGKAKKVSFAFTRMYPPVNFVSVNFDFQKLGLWSDPLLGQKPNLAVIYGSSYPERVI